MRKIREVLRLKHERGLSHQAVVSGVRRRRWDGQSVFAEGIQQCGLGWPLPAELDDAALDARTLFRRPAPVRDRARPDCAYIHRELKRNGVTRLQLLWEEYLRVHSDTRLPLHAVLRDLPAMGAAAAAVDAAGAPRRREKCSARRKWNIHRLFRQAAGARREVLRLKPAYGGACRRVELFVAVLGASSLTYAEATETQQLPDWVDAHIRHGGVLRRRDHAVGPRPVEERRHSPLPLRARRQPHLRRSRGSLRRRRRAGTPEEAPRQGCRRRERTAGPALDTGPAPRPDLLRARPAQRGDPRPARRAERPADEEAGRQPPRPPRAARPPGTAAPARYALHPRALEAVPRQHRLPRRGRAPRLQACRTNWSASRSRSATPPTRSRSSIAASASCRTAGATTDSRRPWPSTCPAPTARMPNGRRRG